MSNTNNAFRASGDIAPSVGGIRPDMPLLRGGRPGEHRHGAHEPGRVSE